jgi:hypothetical protein
MRRCHANSGLTARLGDALRHPEVANCGDDDRDVVIGAAYVLVHLCALAWRLEHGSAERIDAVEQDRQHQPVIGTAQIEQRLPGLQSQLHGGEESHAPRVRKGKTILRFLKDWRVLPWHRRQGLADRVEARHDRCDRRQGLAVSRGDATACAEQIDKPLVGRDRAGADDDRGHIAEEVWT